MLRGVGTVRLHAADLGAATRWYAEVLGVDPYFERPGYAEFRIGDYQQELGLMDSAYLSQLGAGASPAGAGPSGAVVYWHVDDLPAALARLLALGAAEHEPPREFGPGFVAAAVADPFGNILGVMTNAHYLQVLAGKQ
jgi:predicted enzyme related to lactoylglutathione lyase